MMPISSTTRASFMPAIIAAGLLVAGACIAPWVYYTHDWWNYWLDWQWRTQGIYPWRPYAAAAVRCDYPPLQLYLLTAADFARRALELHPSHPANILLVKLPWLIALAGGAVIVARLAPLVADEDPAAPVRAALAWAMGLPLFINAAMWGQADTLLALLLVATIGALWKRRLVAAGAFYGLALSLKLHAVFILPVLIVYAWREHRGWSVPLAAGVSLAVVAMAALPMILAGQGGGVLAAYLGAVDEYPLRTVDAFNLWFLVQGPPPHWADLASPWAGLRDDSPLWAGAPIWMTAKHVGLSLLAAAQVLIAISLWRRPSPARLSWAAATSIMAVFTLATQMHDRYAVPSIGLLAMCAWRTRRETLIYLLGVLVVGLNQVAALANNWSWEWETNTRTQIMLFNALGMALSLGHLALLGLMGWHLARPACSSRT